MTAFNTRAMLEIRSLLDESPWQCKLADILHKLMPTLHENLPDVAVMPTTDPDASACNPRDVLLAPSMGPYLLEQDLDYGALLCRWFIVGSQGFCRIYFGLKSVGSVPQAPSIKTCNLSTQHHRYDSQYISETLKSQRVQVHLGSKVPIEEAL